jgi:hypothetical protein
MQIFSTTCLLLALGSAFALPSTSGSLTKRGACNPIEYRCHPISQTPVGEGWDVCDVSGNWVWGGACAPNQQCVFNTLNGSPYCVPVVQPVCSNGDTMCTTNGEIQTCNNGAWSTAACSAGQTCSTQSGVASCTGSGNTGPCHPVSYQCSPTHNGWDVCTTWNEWVNGGDCAAGQTCHFNTLNGSPYCY